MSGNRHSRDCGQPTRREARQAALALGLMTYGLVGILGSVAKLVAKASVEPKAAQETPPEVIPDPVYVPSVNVRLVTSEYLESPFRLATAGTNNFLNGQTHFAEGILKLLYRVWKIKGEDSPCMRHELDLIALFQKLLKHACPCRKRT